MIVSASARSDIPAFYARWFLNRLDAGFCRTVNPFNPRQHQRISLAPGDVDGFVFWTRNPLPFLPALGEVRRRGLPFVVTMTITGAPRALEARVPRPDQAVETARRIAGTWGPDALVWRYDPIVTSSLTDRDHHLRTVERLARGLEGATDEVVVSFVQPYRKTRRNLDRAAAEGAFTWEDPDDEAKRGLLEELRGLVAARGMALSLCSQPHLLVPGVQEASCVDAERLARIAGRSLPARIKGTRPGCRCHEARDIGAYDTCPHGCQYCYAVRDRGLALRRHADHDPEGEYLIPVPPPSPRAQLGLFGG